MANISTSIDLAKLKCVIQEKKGTSGMVKCLVIPLDANDLVLTEKNQVFLNTIGFELKEKEEGKSTHIVKQSFKKDSKTKEFLDALPILGNHTLYGSGGGNSAPQTTALASLPEGDDIPF